MTDEPARPRRFHQDDVARIIRRAGELQERHGGLPPAADGMTLNEIEQVASEVGISPEWVREAVRAPEAAPLPAPAGGKRKGKKTRSKGSLIYGGPRVYRCEASLEGTVRGAADLTNLPSIIHDVLERHGDSRITEDGMEWSHEEGAGSVHVTVIPVGDRTHIVAEADRTAQAKRNLRIGTLGLGTLFALIGASSGEPAISVMMGTMGAAAGGISGRLWWNHQSNLWRKRLNGVMQRLSDSVGARLTAPSLPRRSVDRPHEEATRDS